MNKEVSLPLAKLLKEGGYNKSCYHYYYNNELESSSRDNWNAYSNGYSAPTIAEVVMWLYEKHKIWISVSPVFEFNDGREDYLTIRGYQYYITVITDNKYNQEKTHADRGNKNYPTEAYEAAIEYTLNNLI